MGTLGRVGLALANPTRRRVLVLNAPGTVCCYALQDKVWAHDPDGVPWEYCTVLEHIETP